MSPASSLPFLVARPLAHPLARVLSATSLLASLAMVLLLSLAACSGDALAPSAPRPTDGGASTPPVDTSRTPVPDPGPRITLLLELQRVGGAALPVTVLDRAAAGSAPRFRVAAYAGSLQLFPDGTYRNGVALTAEVDGAPQPVRVVADSGTYRLGVGRITLVSHSARWGVRTVELGGGADSTWSMEQVPEVDATPARYQYGTARTRPPVLSLAGAWSAEVTGLTDGAVRCTLRGFGYALTDVDGTVAGESTAESGAGAGGGMDCAIIGRVPPFVTPTYGAGMPVAGRIVGDRVVLETSMPDAEGNEALAWRIDGRVVASDTQMWSHVEGTLTVRERDGGVVRSYTGRIVLRRR